MPAKDSRSPCADESRRNVGRVRTPVLYSSVARPERKHEVSLERLDVLLVRKLGESTV